MFVSVVGFNLDPPVISIAHLLGYFLLSLYSLIARELETQIEAAEIKLRDGFAQ